MSEIKGMDSLMRKLNALGGNVPRALYQGVADTIEVAAADAKMLAPKNSSSQSDGTGSGSIVSGIQTKIKTLSDGAEGSVISTAAHSIFVEMGTGPVGAANHAGISPKVSPSYTSRESWAYPTVIDGEETYRVTSGQPARPFMYPAAVMNKDTFIRLTKLRVLDGIRKAGG
jgi:HK97 gp10 family phage protein